MIRVPFARLSSPRSIEVSPASIRSSVVLPAPLRPASVRRSRRSSLKDTPRSSGCPAMSLCRSDAIITAIGSDGRRPAGRPPAPVGSGSDMRRLSRYVLPLALLLPLVLAPAAQAYNDGRGFYGATNDKVVTDAGFILIIFFPVFVFVMSMIQRALEKRKQAR